MPYRKSYSRRRTVPRRRRFYRRKRYSKRNIQQRQAYAGIRMKFTKVFTPEWEQNEISTSWTVALLGTRGDPNNGTYYNLADCNPDNKLAQFASDYQQACITGVAVKMIFPEPTTVEASPVQWSQCYSPQYLLKPDLTPDTLQSLSTFQTGPCSQNRSVTRYYPMSYVRKKLGIDYFPVDELVNNGTVTGSAFDLTDQGIYNAQLGPATGPSLTYRVYRNQPLNEQLDSVVACRFQLTYYVRFRGTKGRTDLE